ncbi:MAG: hypothetical protein KJ964_09550 [Verrucomicrobia bacterium]|nr:hypothetical protein [Verrucomicrobiota bacterium]MBU1855808.1 hypothetical protein [Verrucomicrobiota bacterium]
MNTVVTAKGGFQRTAGLFLAVGLLMAAETGLGQYAEDGFNPDANDFVYAIATQADGKIILGGNFDTIGGVARTSVARVLPDGRLDTTFAPGVIPSSIVEALAIQADGKVIIGGEFSEVAGQTRYNLARLNADGSLDAAFNPNTVATEADKSIAALAIQPDGKIIVGGFFVNLGGQMISFIGRLNADGSLDTAFNPTANGDVNAIVIQPDGKILVGGDFSSIGGAARSYIARLNCDGSLDTSFVVTNANNEVYSLAIQADGKILAGGLFTTIGGQDRNFIARLNTDGSVDTAFNPNANGEVMALAIQPNGKIVAGGTFTTLGGTARIRIGRLNLDGTVDDTFESPGGVNGLVCTLAVQADGKVLAGGVFTTLGNVLRNYIGRLYPDGRTDQDFDPAASLPIYAMALQTDGNILIGGPFHSLQNGADLRQHIARIHNDDTTDTAFDPGAGDTVYGLAVQSNDMIVAAGIFHTLAGGVERLNFGRLSADGTLDAALNPAPNAPVYALAMQTDGKIVAGGGFTKLWGEDRFYIGRLNADGPLDSSFTLGALALVKTVAMQPDGKILVGGAFTTLGDQPRLYIGRFNADGSLDTSFDPGADSTIFTMAVQADGKIIVGGAFTTLGGQPRNCIGRLNADGSLDTEFNPNLNVGDSVLSIVLQADGKILIGGSFTTVGVVPVACNNIARLNADGSLDTTFDLTDGAVSVVYSMALQTDGKIIVGGAFDTIGGKVRKYLARIANTEAALQSLSVGNTGNAVTWTRTGTSPEVWRTTFEQSTDGTAWTSLGTGTRITNGWQITGLSLPFNQMVYIRARGYAAGGIYNSSASIYESVRLCYLPNRIDNDFDGDRKSDLAVYRDGYWSIYLMAGSVLFTNAGVWGGADSIPVPGDYDGDRKSDLAVYCDGYWSIYSLANGIISLNAGIWGGPDWTPVSGDYDGDGISDLAAYCEGYWSIYSLANGTILSNAGAWGGPGWTPVPGDYDGDGISDLAVYCDGYWSIYSLANGIILLNAGAWGGPGWTPAPGDYDGDGISDLAVYCDGYWSIYSLANGIILLNAGAWGGPDSITVPGDYDGDRKSDLTVYRDGNWSIYSLANGIIRLNGDTWGGPGWTPVR